MLFGEIPEGLTNEYIINAMKSINPNFNWVNLFSHVYHKNLNPIGINFREVKKTTNDPCSVHYSDDGDNVLVEYDVRRWRNRSYLTSDAYRVTARSIITSRFNEIMYERAHTSFIDRRRRNDISQIMSTDKYDHTRSSLEVYYPNIFRDTPNDIQILQAIRSIQPDFNMGYIFSRETFISNVRSQLMDDSGMNRIYHDILIGRIDSMSLDADILKINMMSWITRPEISTLRSIFPGCIVSLDLRPGEMMTRTIHVRALNPESCKRLKLCITAGAAAMMERH